MGPQDEMEFSPVSGAPTVRADSPTRSRGSYRIGAVLFDFDGTLTKPDLLDLTAIKAMIGCPPDKGILEYLRDIEDTDLRRKHEAVMLQAEAEAADHAEPSAGAESLVAFLRSRKVPMAIITRNVGATVERALARFSGVSADDFALIVSRDLPVSPKPFPDGVLYVAGELGVPAGELLVIGDHAFDIEAGAGAGALTMFVRHDSSQPLPATPPDFVVEDLDEARRAIRRGLPLPIGKLPADLLQESLQEIVPADPTVLVGAAIGEDAAAVDVEDAEILVLASDPITLATDFVARYAVVANANDVATTGANPRWLLTTLLFPPGSTPSEIAVVVRDLQAECARVGASLCGGHTEITDAVSRPLVVGTMTGTAETARLVDKRHMQEGDVILLTKGVAIEGTGLIAREFPAELARAGMSETEIAECAAFLDRVGILDEARIAASHGGVTAMHDVTEGGLATALMEFGAAGGHRLRVHVERIPVYPQTSRVCAALGLDPMGLIGSGSLLIACSPEDSHSLAGAVAAEGIEIVAIGEVLGRGEGIEAVREGTHVEWPHFEHDEVSRLGH